MTHNRYNLWPTLAVMALVMACTNEEFVTPEGQPSIDSHIYKMRLNLAYPGSATRGVVDHDYKWPDNSSIEINFTINNDNIIPATATYSESDSLWAVNTGSLVLPEGANGLPCTFRYLKGKTLPFRTPIYTGSSKYALTNDKDITVDTLTLHPATWRLRFQGGAEETVLSFSSSDIVDDRGESLESTIPLTTAEDGYTPYIYALLANADRENTINVEDGGKKYHRIISGTDIKLGGSYMLYSPSFKPEGWDEEVPPVTDTLWLSSKTLQLEADGTGKKITVNANTNWRADMPEGLACNPSSGAESKEVTVSATGKNEEIAQKKFDIVFMTTGETVVRDTLHVTQNGAEPRINVQERLNIDTNGNEASLHVNSNTTWTAQVSYTDGSGWLRGIVTSNYGIKELDMKVSAEKNESIYSREAKITFTADGVTPVTVTVTQSGTTASTSVTPSKLDFEATGDDTGKEISVTSNEVWTVSLSPIVPSDSPYWCHVSPMQEEGSGSVKVTVEDNESTETERSATIIITGTTSKEHSEVTVTQSKKEIVLRVNDSSTPSAITISADGTGQQVYVESNTTWTVSTSDNWLTCTPNKYNGSTWITVSAEANKLTTEKKGKLVFTADDKKEVELTVIQKGDKIRFEVEPTELFFGHTNAPRQWVSVDCNVNYIVNPGSSSWCDYELDSDKGFYVSVEDNPNYTPRTTIITVDAPDSNKPAVEIIVKQEGKTNIAVTPFGPDEDWDNK